jgi:REP element-mobilizing transposase RayT
MERTIKKYRIASARLKEYDYSAPNWYFVTINTKDHHECFGEIKSGRMFLNELGKIMEEEWLKTSEIRKNIELDYYVVMPNHFHSIIIITEKVETRRGVSLQENEDRQNKFSDPIAGSLSVIINQFKGAVTKRSKIIKLNNFSWQPRFYDRIIRNERELNTIRNYIEQNPLHWELDYDKETLEL